MLNSEVETKRWTGFLVWLVINIKPDLTIQITKLYGTSRSVVLTLNLVRT